MRVVSTPQPLERRDEVAALADALARVVDGRGGLVVVEGPPGIGKTTLLEGLRGSAGGVDVRLLAARGGELEQDDPWGVATQLFGPLLAGAGTARREEWLAGGAGAARVLLGGGGVEVGRRGGEAASGAPASGDLAVRQALWWLVAALAAERPLVLVVDDAQWSDAGSLAAVHFLARRVDQLPLLLVVATRPRAAAVGPLLLEPGAVVLRPAALSPEAVLAWARAEVGADAEAPFAAAVQAATAGNPFLVRELLREVRAEGIAPRAAAVGRLASLRPETVLTSVMLRLASVRADARALAVAAAVLGDGAALDVAVALAGVAPEAAGEAGTALARVDVLRAEPRVRFAHPLVRTAIYEDLPPHERARLHGRAALLLHERGESDERVAGQLLEAPPVRAPWALAALRAAAERASSLGAHQTAAHHLARALAEAEGDDERRALLVALAQAEAMAGSGDAAAHLREAGRLATEPTERAAIAFALGRVLRFAGEADAAIDVLEGLAGARVATELLACVTMSRRARLRLAPLRAGLAREDPTTLVPRRFGDAFRALDVALEGGPPQRVEALVAAALASPPLDDPSHEGQADALAALALMFADRHAQAERLCDRLVEGEPARQSAATFSGVLAQRAFLRLRRGQPADARADAELALELGADRSGARSLLSRAAAVLTYLAIELDEEPDPRLAAIVDDTDAIAGRYIVHARAVQLIARGELREGRDALLAFGARELELDWGGAAHAPWRSQAGLASITLGERDAGERLVEEELALVRAAGAPRALGIALRARARAQADPAEREVALREAVAVLVGSGAELELARALTDLGAALRRGGTPAAAREPLRRGHELAQQCGATPLAERARAELRAAGARPRVTRLTGSGALTPSERRVVELVAGGASNREAAQTLFVTEKTVETHLRHAYAKLGVRSRRELPAALAEG